MYNGRAFDSPVVTSADARVILTELQIPDDVADGLVEYIVESEGPASFDDFRCQFRIAELVAKAKMPVGHTTIDEPGLHDTRFLPGGFASRVRPRDPISGSRLGALPRGFVSGFYLGVFT